MPNIFKKYLTDPDVQLMLKCKKGDQAAFEQLLDKYKNSVVNVIYRFMANKAEAEDLAQEVFLKIYNHRFHYKPKAKFSTWLFRITTNLCLNQIRDTKKYTSRTISLDEPLEAKEGPRPKEFEDTKQINPSEVLLQKELERVVQEAVEALPSNQRMAVILRRYQDLPYEDIAKALNCSVANVKTILFRAKENLRENLKKYI